jgi:Rieske Fe-S protein
MVDYDRYPEPSARRRFIKGVVGSSALVALGIVGGAVVNASTPPKPARGGIENTDGPAPRPMPQIPVQIDPEGYVSGLWPAVKQITQEGVTVTVAEEELGGTTYSSEWFQYCGIESAPGLNPTADQDNYFRYEDASPYTWQQQNVTPGDRVHVDDFADYETWGDGIGQSGIGKPATATWRSEDVGSGAVIPVQIIRSSRIEAEAANDEWLAASTREGFIAIMDKCTHFCCVPLFKADQTSTRFGAADQLYCPCHQSVYDPFSVIQQTFIAFPRSEE